MELIPYSEANSHSTSEIPCISWNWKFHCHVHHPTTGTYPEPDESSPQNHILFL